MRASACYRVTMVRLSSIVTAYSAYSSFGLLLYFFWYAHTKSYPGLAYPGSYHFATTTYHPSEPPSTPHPQPLPTSQP